MFAADAVKLARLWGLNRVSWLRGHCFWVGECGDWNERRFGDGGDGSRKGSATDFAACSRCGCGRTIHFR